MNESTYIDPFSGIAEEFAKKFDSALDNRDRNRTEKLIEEVKEIIEKEDFITQTRMYYSLGTVYGDMANWDATKEKEEFQNRQLYYLRKSISQIDSNEFDKPEYLPYVMGFTLNLYTNYGNALDHIGRKIAAIEQYKRVLDINPQFGMALGNLGIAYRHYGMLVYDPGHRVYFHHFAYHYLSKGIESQDPSVYEGARHFFIDAKNGYHSDYVEHILGKPLEIPSYSYDDESEYQYREWALNNNLFLNPLNDLPVAEFCFAADVLQLPNMLAKLEDKPIFHGMFNQFKQEYIYARYQCYCGLEVCEETHFADKDTCLLNFADYPQYSIRIEMIKGSFRSLYSLLDKVAYFINSYFHLGIRERDVSFHNIWLKERKGRNGYKYKNTLNHNENFALASIYWIGKDFYERLSDSPYPKAKRVSELRNALEHKYVKVHWDLLRDVKSREVDDLAMYISERELIDETIRLMKLIREVLICLSLAVRIEEDKRRESMKKDEVILPKIPLFEYDDNWKL